ncbi:unnamed protein product, partial [Candida parapsilosis]
MVSAVILVRNATPDTIIQFQDQLANDLPMKKGVFSSTIREEATELGLQTECIPDTHLDLGATTGLNDPFDILANQKLQSLWTQKQMIKGDGGQIYELENGNLCIRTSNVFLHGSFKGLLIQVEISDRSFGLKNITAPELISSILKKYGINEGKVCTDVLDARSRDNMVIYAGNIRESLTFKVYAVKRSNMKKSHAKAGLKAHKREGRKERRQKEEEELKQLKERIENYNPNIDEDAMQQFSDLPITQNTLRGLKESSFISLTDIQKKTIPIALKGHDLMGTARTGS